MADVTDFEAQQISQFTGIPVWIILSDQYTDTLAQAKLREMQYADRDTLVPTNPPVNPPLGLYDGTLEGIQRDVEEWGSDIGEGVEELYESVAEAASTIGGYGKLLLIGVAALAVVYVVRM